MSFLSVRPISFLAFLLITPSLTTQAEPVKPTKTKDKPRTQASPTLENGPGMQRTREMEMHLALLEYQFIKLLPLNRDHLTQRSSIAEQYASDANLRATKLAQLDASYERAYRRVLTLRQALLMEEGRAAVAPEMNMGYFMVQHF